jgi:hypothetical protein
MGQQLLDIYVPLFHEMKEREETLNPEEFIAASHKLYNVTRVCFHYF